MKFYRHIKDWFVACLGAGLVFIFSSCHTQQKIATRAQHTLQDSAFAGAHAGIYIYDPEKKKALYAYNADKYFVPGSNTKIATCYAAMKYLGDSLAGIRYRYTNKGDMVELIPTGDPTLLHTDFKRHPVMDFLYTQPASYLLGSTIDTIWKDERFGNGWSWDDYYDYYMVERSALPVYGNTLRYELTGDSVVFSFAGAQHIRVTPRVLGPKIVADSFGSYSRFSLKRQERSQYVRVEPGGSKFTRQFVPVYNVTDAYTAQVLNQAVADFNYQSERQEDSLKKISENSHGRDYISQQIAPAEWRKHVYYFNAGNLPPSSPVFTIHSQATDSVLKPMMHRSDNFYAEQLLLMVSNEKLGQMRDAAIIDHLLQTDFKDIPQTPKWVDGSGLSRYNLFSPHSFVWILEKMKNEFGMARIKEIFPTGGEGTLRNLFKADSGFIYAKTGTLSNHSCLSGFLITQKGTLLIFSVLVNHYMNETSAVRRAVEALLLQVRREY